MLKINKTADAGKVNISLEGRLDTVTSPELDAELKEILEGTTELTLDFAGLEYVSSAGLRVLLAAQKTMMNQGTLKIVNVNDVVMEIFEVTGFTDILKIEP
ncbi:MAG: STAS domain-containing protein [Solobacterium sp.]|nr:STAS domain-containing protein [Solobacterium sp.]